MSHITLIRHGQANSGATTEEDYDRLSPLGHQQAAWLGDHLQHTGQHHLRLYTGTLRRHSETASSMKTGLEAVTDARLNELEYYNLAQAMLEEHGLAFPVGQESFATHLPKVFSAWSQNQIEGAPETFAQFETRVTEAIHDISQGDGPALVVTSGGLISMVMRRLLNLDIDAMAHVALGIMNTSVHRLFPIGGRLTPVMFNAIPHLEQPDRHHAQTHV